MLAVVVHQFGPMSPKDKTALSNKRAQKAQAYFPKKSCASLCLFVASFLLRGPSSFFLFFVEALLILLQPRFEIV